MKNKFLFLFIFLFVNLTNNIFANDFTFDVDEINISNNGNIINGSNGTARAIDNSLEIKADQLIYNKDLSTLDAIGNVFVKDFDNGLEIKADQLMYDKSLSTLDAIGNVLVKDSTNEFFLRSQKIFYDIKNQQISSKSKSQFEDILGNLILSEDFIFKKNDDLIKFNSVKVIDLQKNTLVLDKAFINVISKKLIGKDVVIEFKDQSFEKNNEPRIKGNSISSDQNKTIIRNGVFTSCKRNDDCPPWQLTAKEIKHDKKKKIISYKSAWLKIYDTPILYFPKFFHPDPTVKRQTGFLMPNFMDSTNLGSSFQLPYYLLISDNKDFTISPRLYADKKLLLQSEYRQIGLNSNFLMDGSFVNKNNNSMKSHFFLNAFRNLDFDYFDETELGLRLEQVSDDNYLKTYKLKSPLIKDYSTLKSSVDIDANKEDLQLNINFEVYENLSKKESDRYEYILPSYSLTKQFEEDESLNGSYTLNSSGFIKNFDTNVYEKVVVNDIVFNSNSTITNEGLKNNYNFIFKNVNTDGDNSSNYKNGLASKLASIFEYNTSYPLRKETINYNNIIKPTISFRYSPNNTKDVRKRERRIDAGNVFNLNRLSLNDTVEGGASLTYGTEFSKENKRNQEVFNFKLANISRFEEDKKIPSNSSVGKKTSDIFGSLTFKPNTIISLGYDFTQKNNLVDTSYEILKAQINTNKFVTTFEYLNENNTIANENFVTNKTSYFVNKSNNISFETRENKKTKATEFYNLIYQYRNDCLIAALEYNQDYYTDKELKPSKNIFFRLTILPFGGANSPNLNK